MEQPNTTQVSVSKPQGMAASAKAAVTSAGTRKAQLFLTFTLNTELFAIEIQRIREIIEYTTPTTVPMLPPSLRGVINVRGTVVPVIDLAIRFGWQPTAVGRRTSIVIVEILHKQEKHMLGLVVDRVNAVTEILTEDIEPPPVFGAHINTEFIASMARQEGRFIVMLNIERTLSVEELAAVDRAAMA